MYDISRLNKLALTGEGTLFVALTLAMALISTSHACQANPNNSNSNTANFGASSHKIVTPVIPLQSLHGLPNTFSTTSPVPFRTPDPGVPVDTTRINNSLQGQFLNSPGVLVSPTQPNANLLSQPLFPYQSMPNGLNGSVTPSDLMPGIRSGELHHANKAILPDRVSSTSPSSVAGSLQNVTSHPTLTNSSGEIITRHKTDVNTKKNDRVHQARDKSSHR